MLEDFIGKRVLWIMWKDGRREEQYLREGMFYGSCNIKDDIERCFVLNEFGEIEIKQLSYLRFPDLMLRIETKFKELEIKRGN